MRPLDEETIKKIRKLRKEAGDSESFPPVLIHNQDRVIVTDGSMLFDWPVESVDQECSGYHKLLSVQQHPHFGPRLGRLKDESWQSFFIKPGVRLVPAVEVDPTEVEVQKMKKEGCPFHIFVPKKGKTTWYYNWSMIALAEFLIEEPSYQMVIPANATNVDIKRAMIVTEGNATVGIFANRLK